MPEEVIIKTSKDAQPLLLQVQALDSAVLQLAHRRRTLSGSIALVDATGERGTESAQ